MSYTAAVLTWLAPVAVVVAYLCRPARERDSRLFARSHGLPADPAVHGFLRRCLTRGRRLRALVGGAALVSPALVAWAVTGDARRANDAGKSWTLLLWGVMVATLWGELTHPRPASGAGDGPGRAALLVPRRPRDYLTWRLRWAPAAVGLLGALAWAVVAVAVPVPSPATGWRSSPPAIISGVALAIVVPPLVSAVGWWVVRRPQPLVAPEWVATDDAVRASSVRMLASAATTMLLLNLAGALMNYAHPLDGAGDVLLGAAVVTCAVLALLAWESRHAWVPVRRFFGRPGGGRPTGARVGPEAGWPQAPGPA